MSKRARGRGGVWCRRVGAWAFAVDEKGLGFGWGVDEPCCLRACRVLHVHGRGDFENKCVDDPVAVDCMAMQRRQITHDTPSMSSGCAVTNNTDLPAHDDTLIGLGTGGSLAWLLGAWTPTPLFALMGEWNGCRALLARAVPATHARSEITVISMRAIVRTD